MEFQAFKKIPRLSREMIVTEKIDGTNAQVVILNNEMLSGYFETPQNFDEFYKKYGLYTYTDVQLEYYVFAGSRKRWLDTSSNGDNFGFAKWVKENAEELLKLGEGRHFGEWYGKGIQRGYGLEEKRFALFNVGRWHQNGELPRLVSINPKTNEEKYTQEAPICCKVVPILYKGMFDTNQIKLCLTNLINDGSKAVSGYMNPEGIVIFHTASGQLFKKTIKNDEKPKGQ